MNRYYTDEEGRVWFAVAKDVGGSIFDDKFYLGSDNRGERGLYHEREYRPLTRTDENGNEVPNIEITDALACSRAELGPVYVVADDDFSQPKMLFGVHHRGEGQPDVIITESGAYNLNYGVTVATPDELKEAGLWE